MFLLQKTSKKILDHISTICLREMLLLLFDQYQNLFKLVQTEHQTNAIYCKLMKRKRWEKYFTACNTTEYLSELLKTAQLYCSGRAHYANVERIFSLMQPHT